MRMRFRFGMSAEADPEHVPDLPLEPVGARPQRRHGIDFRIVLLQKHLYSQPVLERQGEEVVDDGEAGVRRRAGPRIVCGNFG